MGNFSYAQIQNLECPNCITIKQEEIELYKDLSPIIIWSDHTKYDHNSIIVLNGWLRENFLQQPVTLTIFNPQGNIVRVDQKEADSQGNFEFQFNTSSNLWKKDGNYIIKVQHGPESRVFKMKVELISIISGEKNECSKFEIKVSADNGGQYCMGYSLKNGVSGIDAELSIQEKTLTLHPRAFGTGIFTIDIPRNLLDSKNGDVDADFVVLVDGKAKPYQELDADDSTERRLSFQVFAGTKNTIEIIGTNVIPEFGMLSMTILSLSIIGVIFLTIRSKNLCILRN